MSNLKVGIVMGSDSDLEVMKEAAVIFESFGVPYTITVMSAHRTPERAADFAGNAHKNGYGIIIAGAGAAAHLAGVMASLTHLPVIGVPVLAKSLAGMDSLYSTVQMPPGIPVATVAINGAQNAGLLAVQILALSDVTLSEKMIAYKKKLGDTVNAKAEKLEKIGYKKYLEEK
ncbi:N5-carboxyaminoimidazole ribonucleotide mutase [Bacteroidota bacterium]|nr:N5-carboxyaminoimidazole ribonucleotide mutase [Bacteroidota bacterium]